jgi:hypothetical protein
MASPSGFLTSEASGEDELGKPQRDLPPFVWRGVRLVPNVDKVVPGEVRQGRPELLGGAEGEEV